VFKTCSSVHIQYAQIHFNPLVSRHIPYVSAVPREHHTVYIASVFKQWSALSWWTHGASIITCN